VGGLIRRGIKKKSSAPKICSSERGTYRRYYQELEELNLGVDVPGRGATTRVPGQGYSCGFDFDA